MSSLLWTLIAVQIALGLFDTVYHHEFTERLAWRSSQQRELRLHAVRNLAYALLFGVIGWSVPGGWLAVSLALLLVAELLITLWDFVEEDRSRLLPATERVAHTLLALNYGAVLALAWPVVSGWTEQPTGLAAAYHGQWSWMCAGAAAGTILFGLRDLAAARRIGRFAPERKAALAEGLEPGAAVLVTGGTGFIGRRLVGALAARGHEVTVLTRSRRAASSLPLPVRIVTNLDQVPSTARIDAIVNLAGEPIGNALWTAAKRSRIINSRVEVTAKVGRLIARLDQPPEVLVNGSAIGWYGLRGDEPLDEDAAARDCFCHRVCAAWEAAAEDAAGRRVRLVRLRIGLVLGREAGLLGRMLTPFEFGLGGRFGSGRQMMSWIHIDDMVRLIVKAVADRSIAGPLNAVAPGAVDNLSFARSLGRALGRPAILRVPAAPLRLALGAFADELLLGGQHVVPERALAGGFRFDYPTIDAALAEITGAPGLRAITSSTSGETISAPGGARSSAVPRSAASAGSI